MKEEILYTKTTDANMKGNQSSDVTMHGNTELEPQTANQDADGAFLDQNKTEEILKTVNDVVLKRYLSNMSDFEIEQQELDDLKGKLRIYKIDEMVYDKDEYAIEKFTSIITSMTHIRCSIFLIIDGHPNKTDFYIGVKDDSNDEKRTLKSISEVFTNSYEGQFPGIKIDKNFYKIEKGAKTAKQDELVNELNKATSVSLCVGVPAFKTQGKEYNNQTYVQGIEKFATAMRGKRYTAIILASNCPVEEIQNLRIGYENIYSQLSVAATMQINASTNESLADAYSLTNGVTDSVNKSESKNESIAETRTKSSTRGFSHSYTESTGKSKPNAWGKAGKLAGPLMTTGAILTGSGVGVIPGIAIMGLGALAGVASSLGTKQITNTTSDTNSRTYSNSVSRAVGKTIGQSITTGTSHSVSQNQTFGQTATKGTSQGNTITIHNKTIEEILKRIDKQLERISQSESSGLWSTGAYFLSYGNDVAIAEIGASIFRSIMLGEGSGVETSSVNAWYKLNEGACKNPLPLITNFKHPFFLYENKDINTEIPVNGTSLISSKELAMMMALPRKSVPGFPVVEHVSLAKEVVRYDNRQDEDHIDLGCVYDQGAKLEKNKLTLDKQSLAQHVFVTGSTGSGKSETVYKLISEAKGTVHFLVIEPAKGEYKTVFGDANVFGSNTNFSPLLRINPFKFPNGIHVLEHIDRIIEIFNVCWPMYAAMPAVLKKAILNAYEKSGWNLNTSENRYGLFPSFLDVLIELEVVINDSAYSEEVKSNYIGSLVTRVESLTNGINGEIFSTNELDEKILFDQNTIIDLSRIGSQETKSLIMGILIMRLNEYRMCSSAGANNPLKHITILEEAHNILRRTSTEQIQESSNVAGKAVEMITNAIAEMRTYGEGFIIVDQSPTSVDIAAIKNTNTKIIMRLPDHNDRILVGKAASMKDEEIDEISKLDTGVAVVYQNDWVSPVLGSIEMFEGKRIKYECSNELNDPSNVNLNIAETLKMLFKGRINTQVEPDINAVESSMQDHKIATQNKLLIIKCIEEFKNTGKLEIWGDKNFGELSKLVTDLLGVRDKVSHKVSQYMDYETINHCLDDLIDESIPNYLNLVLKQALMKDYSLRGPSFLKRYEIWYRGKRHEIWHQGEKTLQR